MKFFLINQIYLSTALKIFICIQFEQLLRYFNATSIRYLENFYIIFPKEF